MAADQVQDIIRDALNEIGVLAGGEQTPANEAAFCLPRLQNMIDSWGADGLTLNVLTRFLFTIPAGQNTFTIGTGATINTPRPLSINQINYVVPGTNPAVETYMGKMNDDQYAALSIKGLSSSLPTEWFYNQGAPFGTLFFWPTVSSNTQVAIYYDSGIAQPAALTSSLVGPPGYREAFLYQLAIRLCGPYGRTVPPLLPGLAGEAYAKVKRQNTQPGILGVDAALTPMPGGAYNVLNDLGATPGGR